MVRVVTRDWTSVCRHRAYSRSSLHVCGQLTCAQATLPWRRSSLPVLGALPFFAPADLLLLRSRAPFVFSDSSSTSASASASSSKRGLQKYTRDTARRRVRYSDGALLRAVLGLTSGLGWSDSADDEGRSPRTRRLRAAKLSQSAPFVGACAAGTGTNKAVRYTPLGHSAHTRMLLITTGVAIASAVSASAGALHKYASVRHGECARAKPGRRPRLARAAARATPGRPLPRERARARRATPPPRAERSSPRRGRRTSARAARVWYPRAACRTCVREIVRVRGRLRAVPSARVRRARAGCP
jgi:hypothetical protein